MDYKTPEDVEFEKLMKRSGKAYDKAMPEADTTYGGMEVKPLGRARPDSGGDVKPIGRARPDSDLEVKPIGRARGSSKDYAKGGSVSSASKRADGIAQRGKTRGKIVMCGGGMAKRK